MRVIGTAGHVDHGKSTLIQALTGTHPDRLKEEQEREMTIDLGFAWWQLANGEEVGVVDVPGHRDFIENMLAGVGGVDAALFVVAADEGIMPQTREHLAILDLLEIPGGAVALTKIDMVEDPEWLGLVEDEVRQALVGTVLEGAPVVRVSAKTGENLEALERELGKVLEQRPERPDLGRPRLPIDRVFTMPGFGTVVTGTLTDGYFSVGDEVEILPGGIKGRVRGLQTHKRKEDRAQPGSRTAVNISGVDVDELRRGQVVAHPGTLKETRRLDVHFKHLAEASQPLSHNTEVKLFLGAMEAVARVRVIGKKALNPGESGWLQIEPRQPVVGVRGDRYILRRPSPGETIGGGVVLDAHPKGRHKRFAPAVLERLAALTKGSPREVVRQALEALGAASLAAVIEKANLEKEAAQTAAAELLASEEMVLLKGETLGVKSEVAAKGYWEGLKRRAVEAVDGYHKANPLRGGMPREELKSRLKLESGIFNALLASLGEGGALIGVKTWVARPGHKVTFSPKQQQRVEALLAEFEGSPFAPPTVKDCMAAVGEAVYQALVEGGRLRQVSGEVVFREEDYVRAVEKLRAFIETNGSITLAQGRDNLGTSRRYVQALLEYMDSEGVTVRVGDARKLGKRG